MSIKNKVSNTDRQSVANGQVLVDGIDDDAILRANGHEAQMARQFNWLAALGLGFSITNSWIGYAVNQPANPLFFPAKYLPHRRPALDRT